jgi:predicted transcriptional regulator
MTAKGRLGKSEKYVIEGMFEDGYSFAEIEEETGRKEATIEKHLRSLAEAEVEETEKEKPKGKNKGLFVRKTMMKNSTGVSIMTEAESSRGERPKGESQSTIKERYKKTIHKISDEK